MWVKRLRVERLRSLSHVEVCPSASLNLIVGPNGSGKTSFLEAIYLLGMGRSFRSRSVRDIVSRGESVLQVFGEVVTDTGKTETLGVERGHNRTRNRISGEDVRSASVLGDDVADTAHYSRKSQAPQRWRTFAAQDVGLGPVSRGTYL